MSESEYLSRHKALQEASSRSPCPRCGKWMDSPCRQALSRRADVYICRDCGEQEAIEDFIAHIRSDPSVIMPLTAWQFFSQEKKGITHDHKNLE